MKNFLFTFWTNFFANRVSFIQCDFIISDLFNSYISLKIVTNENDVSVIEYIHRIIQK